MKKLSKSEFMTMVINDLNKKKLADKERQRSADRHIFDNIDKINRRKKKWK